MKGALAPLVIANAHDLADVLIAISVMSLGTTNSIFTLGNRSSEYSRPGRTRRGLLMTVTTRFDRQSVGQTMACGSLVVRLEWLTTRALLTAEHKRSLAVLTIGEATCFDQGKRIVFEVGMKCARNSNDIQACRRMVSCGVGRNVMLAQHSFGQVDRRSNLDRDDCNEDGQRDGDVKCTCRFC